MSSGRDDAESVSEAKAQSGNDTAGGGSSCLMVLAKVALFIVLAVLAITWGG